MISARDIDLYEKWWIQKSRINFLAYRMYMRADNFKHNWFIDDLCSKLQQFYVDCKKGLRPILLITTPPQHGKSWTVADFISWIAGKNPTSRIIFATFSDMLGTRCNLAQQRQINSAKYKKIFPDLTLSNKKGEAIKTLKHLEFMDSNRVITGGSFRNTTVGGSVTGETLDYGIIDDVVKGREQANSVTWSQKIWEWYTDDFSTRLSEMAGLLIIMTRWSTHDIIARLLKTKDQLLSKITMVNYQAIATKDEEHRRAGEPLFPELKSKEFLENRKATRSQESWESLYQGNPTVTGGNLFKDDWWQWWHGSIPLLKYKFITVDTAQKVKTQNDWTVFQAWGMGFDNKIYLLDKLREKFEAPELRREAEIFYKKHDHKRINLQDPILRAMYIEDKSSGTGLLQELRRKGMKVVEIPRNKDKVLRAQDAAPYIEAGRVVLNTDIAGIGNLTKEAREFPNSEFDDDIDTLITAVEVAFINQDQTNLLQAAMEAPN